MTNTVARNITNDHQGWKHIVNSTQNPAGPTAVYWLRGQPAPQFKKMRQRTNHWLCGQSSVSGTGVAWGKGNITHQVYGYGTTR